MKYPTLLLDIVGSDDPGAHENNGFFLWRELNKLTSKFSSFSSLFF
jgi:hypothetical protein